MGNNFSRYLGSLINSGDTPLGLSSAGNQLYFISSNFAATKGPKFIIKTLDCSSGKQTGLVTLKIDHDVVPESILFIGRAFPILVWTDMAIKVLNINIIGSEHISSFQVRNNDDEQVNQIFVHAPHVAGAQVHLLVHYQSKTSHSADIYHVNISSRSTQKAYDLPLSSGFGAFSASAQGGTVFFTRITETEISLFSSFKKDELAAWPINKKIGYHLAHPHSVSYAVSEVVSKGMSKYAVRSALVLPTGDLELIRNGEHLWHRPESLAGVEVAAFIEPFEERGLAAELAVESHSSLSTAYIHRVKRHLRALKHFPAWAMSLSSDFEIGLLGARPSEAEPTTLDGFGFRKLVIVATDSGRLIALDTGNQGRVIWNTNLFEFSRQRGGAVSIESENDIALIRGHEGEFWRVLISNGTVIQHQPRETSGDSKVAIAVLDTWGEKLLLSIKEDGTFGNRPKSKARKGTIIVTRGTQGAVRGWSLTSDADPVLAWEFWPVSGDIITKVIMRPTHDPIASIGKALGDRNVLYKYINTNILFVITTNSEDHKLTVYLLDSASGHILHTAIHRNIDITQPVAAIASENWLAYTLFGDATVPFQESIEIRNSSSRAFQLIVSELYESQYRNERGALDFGSNFSSIYPNTVSNGIPVFSPHIMSQAYSIPGPISHLSITSTLQGITPRSLLCFLPYQNALISIPRTVLDPRRPIGRDPNPAELEEGLFKHNPLLDFEPKWILNHKREIFSLRGIITSPSLLESTSLVFAYGKIDIFGTKVSPIGGFDMLGKGFSKLQLLGTVIALAIGTGLVAPMVGFLQPSPNFFMKVDAYHQMDRFERSKLTTNGKFDSNFPATEIVYYAIFLFLLFKFIIKISLIVTKN